MAVVVVLVGAAIVGTASAASSRTVRVTGSEEFIANAKVMATLRFTPGPITVRSGDSVTWVGDPEPHTISVVAAADLPTEFEDLFDCAVCNAAVAAHLGTNPPTMVVQAPGSAAGLDAVGDSLFLPPEATVSATVSASAGSTLHYLCAIHPWMQGTINVH